MTNDKAQIPNDNMTMELTQYKTLAPAGFRGQEGFFLWPFCHLVAVAVSKWFIET
jgi:hypothetical protein